MVRVLILVFALLCSFACKRDGSRPGDMLTFLSAADPNAAAQLVSGFYGVEENRFRWTAGRFSAVLRLPSNAARKGTRLYLQLFLPATIVEAFKEVKLTAEINGVPLAPETFTKSGPYEFRRDVEARLVGGEEVVTVNFSLDKSLPPNATDKRELGLAVEKIGFEKK